MKKFEDLLMQTKLLISFGLILAMLLGVIIVAYMGLQGIIQSEKELYDIHFQTSLGLRSIRSHQNFNRAASLNLLLTKDKEKQIEIEKTLKGRELAINDIIEKLSKLNQNFQFQNKMNELKNEIELYLQIRDDEISLIQDGKTEQAKLLGISVGYDQYKKIRLIASKMGETALKKADEVQKHDMRKASLSILIFVLIGILALLFSIVMIISLNRAIVKPLNKITKIAKQISDGNLNIEFPFVKRKDEIGILLQNFSKMVNTLKAMSEVAQKIASGDLTGSITPQSDKDILGNTFLQMLNNLRRIMNDISEGVNLLASSSSEIVAATTQVSSCSTETASAISETTTTVEEVRQAAKLSSQKASLVSDNAQKVVEVTHAGQKAVDETVNGMHNIQNQMEDIANTIILLSEQSQQIGGIIASVNDVADQSNLLAVNAAIEAAKVGEQGLGFSVIAQEIKDLALQSKQATMQVRNILNDIQKSTSAAVMATEQGSKIVENGVNQSIQTGESIRVLSESVNESVQTATQIVASSQQQTVGMNQIVLAMQNINQAGTENAASMIQAKNAAKDLNKLGLKLRILVDQYKT
ncbi:MAG: methyl-accepting chemotaxis protein [Bacteroidetes bacterium]|nr:methyl-accepting chemotaxis protein [Bacteroidota bacterium]